MPQRFRLLVVLPIAATLTLASAVGAEEEVGGIDDCERQIVHYGEAGEGEAGEDWLLEIPAASGGGALHYQGAVHSRDPDHPQVGEIVAAWERFAPTVALYEGPDRGHSPTVAETVASTGESGLVRHLAARDGVRVVRLEPGPVAEVDDVLEAFPVDQVKLFFVLREASRLRDREGMGEAELAEQTASLLERARALGGEVGQTITTLAELEEAFRRYWPEPLEWWQAPARWFDPLLSSAETGGIFTNEINKRSSGFRNHHMFRTLAAEVARGERVFAVVGRNHVPMQAPALRCALED